MFRYRKIEQELREWGKGVPLAVYYYARMAAVTWEELFQTMKKIRRGKNIPRLLVPNDV